VRAWRTWTTRSFSLEAELAVVAVTLLAWHAIRIPLEGGVGISVEHARDVLHLEGILSLDFESSLIRLVADSNVETALRWLYANIHLPVLFAFIAAMRLLAPDRYPLLRTTFVASFIPAALVIGLYPLAPPRWMPELGLGHPPAQSDLAGSTATLFHNETAAAASQHFGFALFLAVASIWLFPRSRLAWTTLAYPVLVFAVVVGTGNHYLFDCVVGTLTFVVGAWVARLVHRGRVAQSTRAPSAPGAVSIALGYGLVVWGFVSFDFTSPLSRHNAFPEAIVLAAGLAAILAPRLATREPVTENG
jgi:PAP2 superfamily